MGQLIPFSFDNKTIRVIADERGEPLFVGKDICDALGYADHINAMKLHCKGVVKRHPLQTAGGLQEVRVLSEGDMFRLVVNSTLPAAEAFERMVFDEILPTIRRTGGYSQPQQTTELARVVEAAGAFDPLMKVALAIGCDQNTAAISANQAIIPALPAAFHLTCAFQLRLHVLHGSIAPAAPAAFLTTCREPHVYRNWKDPRQPLKSC